MGQRFPQRLRQLGHLVEMAHRTLPEASEHLRGAIGRFTTRRHPLAEQRQRRVGVEVEQIGNGGHLRTELSGTDRWPRDRTRPPHGRWPRRSECSAAPARTAGDSPAHRRRANAGSRNGLPHDRGVPTRTDRILRATIHVVITEPGAPPLRFVAHDTEIHRRQRGPIVDLASRAPQEARDRHARCATADRAAPHRSRQPVHRPMPDQSPVPPAQRCAHGQMRHQFAAPVTLTSHVAYGTSPMACGSVSVRTSPPMAARATLRPNVAPELRRMATLSN